jgi:RimJ/RimL family protein N-acetyltransferase
MTDVRPGSLDDAAAYLEIRRESFPWLVNTSDGVRYQWQQMLDTADGALFRVDDEAGAPAAFGRCSLTTWTSEAGAANATLVVRADLRGRGIGTALLAALEEHLRGVGGRKVSGYGLNRPEVLRWMRANGYETTGELRYSEALLADLPPTPELPAGVTVVTFEEAGPEPTYLVDAETIVDEPGEVTYDKVGYDDWKRDSWDKPTLRRDLSVVVFVDGEPAACTLIEADPDAGQVWSAGTGTRRPYRGRGLAKIAKSVGLRKARDAGMSTAFASNDEVNAPMLAVNEWLGYRPVGSEMECVKVL